MSNQNEVSQISALFSTLTNKLDRMSRNIESIANSLINLTDQINNSLVQVSGNLENVIVIFEKTFQFKDLVSSKEQITKISDMVKSKFNIDDFQKNLNELNVLIGTLKQLKDTRGGDEE